MFGHDRPGGSPWGSGGFQGVNISIDDLFGGSFDSIFSSLFGGGGRQRSSRGADLLIRHDITFQDAYNGVDDELDIDADPLVTLHAPVPKLGLVAAIVKLDVAH